jgi:3-phenylpropionate/trans-cinnamate dioxygenase ferredoxin reductase component
MLMSEDQTFVIVGAGLAGGKAAETLRGEGFDGRIVLIGDEPERPYERPPLSKGFLLGKEPKEKAYVHAPGWYDEHRVELRLSTRAVGLDTAGHTLALAGGETLRYDKLLIATGAVPRPLPVPGTDLDGVLYLCRFPDSERIKGLLREGLRLVVVGAGWIGLEVTAAAREAGAEVTVVEVADLPLQRVLGDEVATIFADLHREHGVDLRMATGVREIRGTGGAERVLLSDGSELPVDAVVVGVGVAPAVALAEAAGLRLENGIITDEYLRTSAPDVYAAGDVANAHSPLVGQRIRVEHWANALNGGPAAARSMLGQDVAYDPVPYFYTDQYDLGMEYAGYVDTATDSPAYDRVVFRGDAKAREFIAFWLKDGRVLAGMNVNIWDVNDPIQAIVRAGRQVDPEQLADPSVPLESFAE